MFVEPPRGALRAFSTTHFITNSTQTCGEKGLGAPRGGAAKASNNFPGINEMPKMCPPLSLTVSLMGGVS